ncbi:hypoxanthine phosphoribosyltransferase [bacterium]|nr:hypoxanthine phosphoribosyltransferase [bacterium]
MVESISHSVLLSANQIEERLKELAKIISKDYSGKKDIVVLGILKGSFIFMADLVRHLDLPITCEFLRIKSYDNNRSSGVIEIESHTLSLKDKHVLVVEDIVDTALTFNTLLDYLKSKEVKSLKTCVLLVKEQAAPHKKQINYLGFTIPNDYVYGYGMDDMEENRFLPFVAKKSVNL